MEFDIQHVKDLLLDLVNKSVFGYSEQGEKESEFIPLPVTFEDEKKKKDGMLAYLSEAKGWMSRWND